MVSSRELSACPTGPHEGARDRTGLCDLIRACALKPCRWCVRPPGRCVPVLAHASSGKATPACPSAPASAPGWSSAALTPTAAPPRRRHRPAGTAAGLPGVPRGQWWLPAAAWLAASPREPGGGRGRRHRQLWRRLDPVAAGLWGHGRGGRPAGPAHPPAAWQVGSDRRRGRRPRGVGRDHDRPGQATRRHRRVDPGAAGGAQRAVPSRPGLLRSTSSKACWSPRRHHCGRRWRAAPPRRWSPPAPGCALTRPPWPIRSRPPKRRCAWSLAGSTSSTRRSAWPTSGWPNWSAAPHPGC